MSDEMERWCGDESIISRPNKRYPVFHPPVFALIAGFPCLSVDPSFVQQSKSLFFPSCWPSIKRVLNFKYIIIS